MLMSQVLSRASRSVDGRAALLLPSFQKQQLPILFSQIHAIVNEYPNRLALTQVSLYHHSAPSLLPFNRFGFTSSASLNHSEKEQVKVAEDNRASSSTEAAKANEDAKTSDEREDSVSGESKESNTEVDGDLSMYELVNLLVEKEELLKSKHKEVKKMQNKVLRTLAEMENVMERTEHEASQKFAIQNFAKSLLDVADNLGGASSVVKVSFSKMDASIDASRAVPHLKTPLEGIEMTEKHLAEVFKKYRIEKFDPTNEPLDPHTHNGAFQIPDSSRPAGTVATVLKHGYMLYDRIIRPAEVGVTHAVDTDMHDEGEKTWDA